jgi:hypothetical protein
MKARQLLSYAQRKFGVHTEVADQRLVSVNTAIVAALAEWMDRVRAEIGDGRPCNKIRQAFQAVLTAIARAPELASVSMSAVADAVHLGSHGVEQLHARLPFSHKFLDEGVLEALFDPRCKVRSDAVPAEKINWIVYDCWCSDDFSRESEKKKDEIFDPSTRKSGRSHHRLRWLETPLMMLYEQVKERAKKRWEGWAPSSWFIRQHRPYWVKDATRDVCLCRYHLQWDCFAKGFSQLRKKLECKCNVCSATVSTKSGSELRKRLTCPRPDGDDFDARKCVKEGCDRCSGMKLAASLLCPESIARAKEIELTWETYVRQQQGVNEFGEAKYKYDFELNEGTGEKLLAEMKEYLVDFRLHHDLAVHQTADWDALKTSFPRGSFVSVQDFSENIHHVVRFEPQSKYYCQARHRLLHALLCPNGVSHALHTPTLTLPVTDGVSPCAHAHPARH